MLEQDPATAIYIPLTMENQPIGFTDTGRGAVFNLAFTDLDALKSFMDNLHARGAVGFRQYKALPTTFAEYQERVREQLGGFDLAVNPPAELVAAGVGLSAELN